MRNFRVWLILCPILFLIGCFWNGSQDGLKNGRKPPQSRFVDPISRASFETFRFDFDLRFKNETLTWEKDKDVFYVFLTNDSAYEDYHMFILHKDSSVAEIYKIFSIDGFGGMWSFSFDTCMGTQLRERRDTVYELCSKKIYLPKSLFLKMTSFLLENRFSVRTYFTNCFGDLNMTYYDGERNYYFDMSKPSCLDDNMKKDPRITESIEFYNEMAAFIKQDFSECRWDNFGNKEKMIRECGKFDWRWKEKYPELVNK